MKAYQVFMYDLANVPVSQKPIQLRGAETKDFSDEQAAISFAKAQLKNWDKVVVHKQGVADPVATFRREEIQRDGRGPRNI